MGRLGGVWVAFVDRERDMIEDIEGDVEKER